MTQHPKLSELLQHGQAIWLDFISRELMDSGRLQALIDQGLRGMTSNPTIFEQSISQTPDYDAQIRALAAQDIEAIYEAVVVQDIQAATDIFRPLFDATNGADGYVSLEVSPELAHDTDGTLAAVYHLNEKVQRPNVMFKIPATKAGIPAVEKLISEGFNINITLMFSMAHYDAVAEAYISGLEKLAASGGDVAQVASVASFFISRVDGKLDKVLADKGNTDLQGKVAIANAKAVYARFQTLFSGERWQKLADLGAKPQRPLWASTSTKNPSYPDTLYVDELIGQHTVNTVPSDTLDNFMDHGTVADTVTAQVDVAQQQLAALADLGIDLLQVGEELQDEGVDKFIKSYQDLLDTIKAKRGQLESVK